MLTWVTNSESWKGGIWKNILPDLSLSGALLLDSCANHGFFIMNTCYRGEAWCRQKKKVMIYWQV